MLWLEHIGGYEEIEKKKKKKRRRLKSSRKLTRKTGLPV